MPDSDMLLGLGGTVEDKRVSIKDILSFIFRHEDIEQKTVLSADNINALIKMEATNAYLREYYRFDIRLYDIIIKEKRLNIIAHKGRGRADILEAVRAMQNPIVQEQEKKGFLR